MNAFDAYQGNDRNDVVLFYLTTHFNAPFNRLLIYARLHINNIPNKYKKIIQIFNFFFFYLIHKKNYDLDRREFSLYKYKDMHLFF